MRRHLVAGFTIVEVLVAVLLLAVGLVGALAMQAHAMRTRQESALLNEALQAGATLAERMRANGGQAFAYLGFEFDAARDPLAGAPLDGVARSCSDSPCDAEALAQRELEDFRQQLLHALPTARAAICRDATSSAGGQLQWRCSDGAEAPIVIKIGWRNRNQDQAIATGPAIALPVSLPPPAPTPTPMPIPMPMPAPTPALASAPGGQP